MNVHVSALTKRSVPETIEKGHPAPSAFALDVLAGLTRHPKQLSPKYF